MAVSVVMSNYKKKKYITEAIQSVFEQTYKEWELLVVDDTNGQDKLEEEIVNFPLSSHRFSLFKTDDIGLSALRMYGTKVSNEKYILFIDADDKIHPAFLEKTVKVLEENPNYSIAYTDTEFIGEAVGGWTQPEYNFYNLLQNNFMCSCSLIRKDDFLSAGGFDLDNFNYWEDYENWILMGSKGFYGKHIPERLFYYRIHKESGMQSDREKALGNLYKAYIINKFEVLYPLELVQQAKTILSQFPPDIMKWKPFEQENYLRKNGIIK